MPHFEHCDYGPLALRSVLRHGRAPGERLIGWGAAAKNRAGLGDPALIIASLVPVAGELITLLLSRKSHFFLILTDHRLIICSTTSPVVGPHADTPPLAIELGDLEAEPADEPGGFRIAQRSPDAPPDTPPAFEQSLRIEADPAKRDPTARLLRGLNALADQPPTYPETHPDESPTPAEQDPQPRPPGWT